MLEECSERLEGGTGEFGEVVIYQVVQSILIP